ncbi:hypothetical protein DPEC_G00090140 [Dallia pectoralis]|uniref:Uncharacterized protein n=1 Tax=Dallia pectoralis TaxID=75939 RepID=A0ACC2H0R8_DALPE|nr:hypothetical protein DPEC_G00090140 [Dallia pectoralis]
MQVEHSNVVDFRQNFEINVELKGVLQDASVMHVRNNVHQRSRTLHCGTKCDEIIVVHLGYLNYTQYQINVTFKGLENIAYEVSVNFMWKMYNPSFSQVEIWFRFVFVVLTFLVTCMFAHSLRKFSMIDWGIEQKWMSILLPLLLLYNDPFFPLSFLVNSRFPGTLDAFFQSLFLCSLLLFWLCVYHGIRVQATCNHFLRLIGWMGFKVLYFGEHLYSDLAEDLMLHHLWQEDLMVHHLWQEDLMAHHFWQEDLMVHHLWQEDLMVHHLCQEDLMLHRL